MGEKPCGCVYYRNRFSVFCEQHYNLFGVKLPLRDDQMPSRFDYVEYDAQAQEEQKRLKHAAQELEGLIDRLPDGRAKALALTHLEITYMWTGKAVRDEQIHRNSEAPLQEGRSNG